MTWWGSWNHFFHAARMHEYVTWAGEQNQLLQATKLLYWASSILPLCVCNYKNNTKTHFLLAELKSPGSNHNVVTVSMWLAKVVHSFIYFPMAHIFARWLAIVVILFCHILFQLCYVFYIFWFINKHFYCSFWAGVFKYNVIDALWLMHVKLCISALIAWS